MYFVGNLNNMISIDKKFRTFEEAFKNQQLTNKSMKIYFWDGINHEIVWDPSWEKITFYKNYFCPKTKK